MHDGDCRKAEGPHAPDSSISIHDDPADAVPYMGSCGASDWSLHGVRCTASSRSTGTTDGPREKPPNEHRRVCVVETRQRSAPSDEAAMKRLDRVCARLRECHGAIGQPQSDSASAFSTVATVRGATAQSSCLPGRRPRATPTDELRRAGCDVANCRDSSAAAPRLSSDPSSRKPSTISAMTFVTVAMISSWSAALLSIGSDLRNVATIRQLVDDGAGDVEPGQGRHPDGQMDRRVLQRLRRVHPTAWQIQRVTRVTARRRSTGCSVTRSAIAARCCVHG